MAGIFENDRCFIKKMEKLKIAYICHLSNKRIFEKLPLRLDFFNRLLLLKNSLPLRIDVPDFAIWNTNAINEFEKYTDRIEFHVISPYPHLRPKVFSYVENGIIYHFFRNEEESFLSIITKKISQKNIRYLKNRRIVRRLISNISPDIVHCVGAENPYYSLCVLDIPQHIPIIVQLQTLMSETEFESKLDISHGDYLYRAIIEKEIINRSNYIGFSGKHYNDVIKERIKKDAVFVKADLALAESVDISKRETVFDFVYFSSNISKAADLAIEAYILASQKHPGITLNVVGGYSEALKEQLLNRLNEEKISQNVVFSGKLPTHEDVVNQIRKARFALLPLKIDLVSGTIREAMANGLPVVTTITDGTPMLNQKRETVLLSNTGDHQALANNMCRLLDDPHLSDTLRINGGKYMEERTSNALRIKRYIDIYYAVLKNFQEGTPIPQELLS